MHTGRSGSSRSLRSSADWPTRVSLLALLLLHVTQVAAPEFVWNGTTTTQDLSPAARRVSRHGGSDLVHEIEWRVPVGCEYAATCPHLSHRILIRRRIHPVAFLT
eukprot:COSAG02_NODE_1951_length_10286_cov_4.096005_10_plen_105_part_00